MHRREGNNHLCGRIAAHFDKLPAHAVNQGVGSFYPGWACCVGAHLADFFDKAQYEEKDFIRGAEAFASALGLNQAQVVLMLRSAGAGVNPFSADKWRALPADVFRNLAEIEEAPPTAGANLAWASIIGAKLESVDFAGAKLEHANFTCAKMAGANLRGADCRFIRFRYTDLQRADLREANLAKCGSGTNGPARRKPSGREPAHGPCLQCQPCRGGPAGGRFEQYGLSALLSGRCEFRRGRYGRGGAGRCKPGGQAPEPGRGEKHGVYLLDRCADLRPDRKGPGGETEAGGCMTLQTAC